MSRFAQCLECGGQSGLMKEWRDADGENHWVHEECKK